MSRSREFARRTSPLPAPTGTESRALDAWAIDTAGVPSASLMERAGTHAAEIVARYSGLPPGARVVAVAGSGNNGGDARIAARCLRAWGFRVDLIETAPDARSGILTRSFLSPDPVEAIDDALLAQRLAAADLVLDGMLGTGASGELRGPVLRVARTLGALRADDPNRPRIVALDLPTGVDADTGRVVDHAVHADATIAFGWPKLGTLLHPGRSVAGEIHAVEIGYPPPGGFPDEVRWGVLDPVWAAAHLPDRPPDAHKYRSGAVLVVAGSEGMAGAAILAARAALRAGAGYLRIASVASNRTVVQAALPEAVWVERDDAGALAEALAASDAVVAGPGIGVDAAARAALDPILASRCPRVLDADALSLLSEDAAAWPDDGRSVVTPHPGEAARILGCDTAEVQGDRLAALERIHATTGGVVLLKGSPSLVAGRHRRLDPSGSSDLATAGIGDVLAGTIASLISQGVEAESAAALGLWLTSGAARAAGYRSGLQSIDVVDHLPAAIATARAVPTTAVAPWVCFHAEAIR
ncbi:MAG: NAD(P)H-hydrate dehydratase [Longimicrobiales bacterium]|nr:NAD(P)H-hydrate dehydratase [Longimicrobiales bacterium]